MSHRFVKGSVVLALCALFYFAPRESDAGNSCGRGSVNTITGMCVCVAGQHVVGGAGNSHCEDNPKPPPVPTPTTTVNKTPPTTTTTATTATTTTGPKATIPPGTCSGTLCMPKDAGAMAKIPAGKFTMGSTDATDKDASPPHSVSVSAFELDLYEVTVTEYWDCVLAGTCKGFTPPNVHCNYASPRQTSPMNCTTWTEAATYCAWRGRRLPSEAEWEYAARGPTSRTYPWGDAAPTCALANFLPNGVGTTDCGLETSQIGAKPSGRTAQGVYDMAGNVEEWTLDFGAHFKADAATDPGGPLMGTLRVVKGGSYDLPTPESLHGAHREMIDPGAREAWVGFRCAKGAMPQPTPLLYTPLPPPVATATPTATATTATTTAATGWGTPTASGPTDPDAMISVKGGKTFAMGENEKNSSPVHNVTLTGYSIDKYEVSVRKYGKCVDAGACTVPSLSDKQCNYGKADRVDHPVNCVTWDEAKAFCSFQKKRLPTEAEWEYAARGTTSRTYAWGNTPISCLYSQYVGCPTSGTAVIGSHPLGLSYFGLYDMTGNVDEWVKDWFGDYSSGDSVDPSGPLSGKKRVIRGGNWKEELGLKAFARWSSDRAAATIGFRCAKSGS